MTFDTEDDAWEYWQDCFEYEDKYEYPGHSFDMQVEMFWEWVENEGVTWNDN